MFVFIPVKEETIPMNRYLSLIISAAVAFVVFSACSTVTSERAVHHLAKDQKKVQDEQERKRVEQVFEEIHKRNVTIKRTPEWLKEAYSSIKIRKVSEVSKDEYETFRHYAVNGDVYLIVHPAYYAFFQQNKVALSSPEDAKTLPSKNIIERFAEASVGGDNIMNKLFLEQERLDRDFLEFMSQEKKLAILLLPKDYKNHMTYGVIPGLDEYARYINEVTNMSESLLYLESDEAWNGYVEGPELDTLTAFLKGIGTRRVLLGGGYLAGRCVDNFYMSLRKRFPYEDIYFVPEILAVSPEDTLYNAEAFFTDKGKISIKRMVDYISLSTEIQKREDGKQPQVVHIPLYTVRM